MRRKKQESSIASSSSSSSSYDFSSWADLPPELLDKIFALLTSSDSLRFRLICSPWRALARLSPPPFPVPFEPPWLLLPRPDDSLFFFNVFNNKSLSFSLPRSHCRSRCFGYHSGWFFFVSDQYPSRACLLNPVFGFEIPLPDLEFPIVKAVLSASPSRPNCVVAVMVRSSSIALCEPAGKKWHVFQLGNRNLRDIIFWNNQVCAIDKNGNLLLCNFNRESCKTEIQTVGAPKPHMWTDGSELEAFLVESIVGELFVVVHSNSQLDTPFRSHFYIFQLFQNASAVGAINWFDITQMEDQALFLGVIRSESVQVSHFPGSGLREKSIYCTSRKFGNSVVKENSMRYYGLSSVPVYEAYSVLVDPVWISPVIWP